MAVCKVTARGEEHATANGDLVNPTDGTKAREFEISLSLITR